MFKAVLIAAVLYMFIGVHGQTPPHVLFTPYTYSVGAVETITLSVYDDSISQLTVDAELTYTECTCGRNIRRTCEENIVYSRDSGISVHGQPVKFKVQMPSSAELSDRRYYLTVTADNGSITFLNNAFVSLTGGVSRGYLFVKTDKPIYKPSQTVQFCVVSVDADLIPYSATVDVRVTDAGSSPWTFWSRNIMKWEDVRIGKSGIKCLEFPLSDEPRFGVWNIFVTEKISRGSCGYYLGSRSETCSFEVKEFVLPRFSVELSGPNRIERNDTKIRGMISAEYTFGEPVSGMATLNFTLEASGRSESLMFKQVVASLNDKGKYSFAISTEEYQRIVRYRFDPFCVKSTIKVTAEVRENGRGTTQSTDMTIPLVANPVKLSFTDTARSFRAGLPYTTRVKATYPDGSYAEAVAVRITTSINNNKEVLFDDEITTDKSGIAELTVSVPSNTKCLQIKAEVAEDSLSCEETKLCTSPAPVYSPSRSFLQITEISNNSPYEVGKMATFAAQSTIPFNVLHVMTISRTNVVDYATIASTKPAQKETEFTISITHELAPSFQLLVFFAREDGELIADLIEVKVRCELKEEVTVGFSEESAQPGDAITVNASADADTPVLVGIIDTSLTLLAESCKSLQSASICDRLGSFTSGSLSSIDNTCSAESTSQCCPTACHEPRRISSRDLFQFAGVNMRSNMFQPAAPIVPVPYVVTDRLPPRPEERIDLNVVAPTGPPGQPEPTSPPSTNELDAPRTRTFFPETWLFLVNQTNSVGQLSIDATVPDTITSWVAQAFSFSQQNGLGISSPTTLTVVKPFFISLQLPFSINFEEEVSIPVLIFNFNSRKVTAAISVEVDDSLTLVNRVSKKIRNIKPNSSKSFVMRLKALGIGNLPIKITATSTQANAQDSVQKLLFVKPGCTKQVNITNVIITGQEETESTVSFDFDQLPSCHIPGSHRASISVTGDIASPPNLDNLLVLPSGCGEQNLVKLALNTVVAKYLQLTVGLPEHTIVRVRFNLQTGYQRQLNYQARGGYFSIWSRGQASSWLTAAAVQVFSEIPEVNLGEESTTIVDLAVVDAAVRYLTRQQRKNGAFPRIGKVHNYQLLGFDGNEFALTAFSLKSLKSYANAFKGRVNVDEPVYNANSYLVEVWRNHSRNSENLCSYGMALAACALAADKNNVSKEILAELKSRIQLAVDGTCFICNDCGDNENIDNENEKCSGPSQSTGASSTCVETTAYTLQALIENEDTDNVVCLSSWLAQQKNRFGVFSSSQDSVVAIRALTRVASLSFSRDLSLNVTVDLPSDGVSHYHQIIYKNRYMKQTYEINKLGQAELRWSGTGIAIVQATLEYYGCDCCKQSRAFSLRLSTRFDSSGGDVPYLTLTMCFQYNGVNHSNMALLDFEVPSGYVYQSWNYVSEKPSINVQRADQTGNGALLYIDEISREQECIEAVAVMAFEVTNPMSPPVTLYDYYNSGQAVTEYYEVDNTPSTMQVIHINK